MIDLRSIPKKPGIYMFTNLINGRQYIGQSIDMQDRARDYKTEIHPRPINRAINKYGWENFKVEILHEFNEKVDKWTLLALETAFIDEYKTLTKYGGYNIRLFGDSNLGCKMPEHMIQRLRERREKKHPCFGRKHTEEAKQKMRENNARAMLGKHPSLETRRKMREARKHHIFTPETRLKLSKSLSGKNNPMYGKKASDETKAKMSAKQKGENHPKFDHTIYTFKNLETGEIFIGTKWDLSLKFNLKHNSVSRMVRKERKHYKKWILSDSSQDFLKRKPSNLDKTIYKFKNETTEETFEGTRYNFYTKYNLTRSCVNELIYGTLKSIKKWILINN